MEVNWGLVFTGAMSVGAVAGIYYAIKEQLKYSEGTKYQVVKKAMMQTIPTKSLAYPKLYAKDQEDMMRRLVFSDEASLVLVEGAQGKLTRIVERQIRLSRLYRKW